MGDNDPAPKRTPMGDLVPPRVVAGPSDVDTRPPTDAATPDFHTVLSGDVPFWRPNWFEALRYIGWRWVIFGPSLVFAVGPLFLLIVYPYMVLGSIAWAWKLWVTAVAWCVYIFVRAIKRGVRDRRDAFCIHCGYTIDGLGESGRCPECGRQFIRALSEEYKRDPHFFAERHKALRTHPKNTGFLAGDVRSENDGTM